MNNINNICICFNNYRLNLSIVGDGIIRLRSQINPYKSENEFNIALPVKQPEQVMTVNLEDETILRSGDLCLHINHKPFLFKLKKNNKVIFQTKTNPISRKGKEFIFRSCLNKNEEIYGLSYEYQDI